MSRRDSLMLLLLSMPMGLGCSSDSIDTVRVARHAPDEEVQEVVFVTDSAPQVAAGLRSLHRPVQLTHIETLVKGEVSPPPREFFAGGSPTSRNGPLNTPAHDVLRQAHDAHATRLEVIANNLANANTTAFKGLRVEFEDRAYAQRTLPAAMDAVGNLAPLGVAVGDGARVQGTQTDFSQGKLPQTGRPLDVAIEGQGFFPVVEPNSGQILYTRAGNFSLNSNGQIVMGSASTGRVLDPPITLPPDAAAVLIGPNGLAEYQQPGAPNLRGAGQIRLATFINPEGLARVGENLYRPTDSSGPPQVGTPGQNGLGTLRQGSLEASNIDVHREMADWSQTMATVQAIDAMLR